MTAGAKRTIADVPDSKGLPAAPSEGTHVGDEPEGNVIGDRVDGPGVGDVSEGNVIGNRVDGSGIDDSADGLRAADPAHSPHISVPVAETVSPPAPPPTRAWRRYVDAGLHRFQAAMRRLWRRGIAVWRRSLQLRVVTATLMLSLVVVGVLGFVIHDQVARGLLEAKTRAATAEATAGFNDAQLRLDAASIEDADVLNSFIDTLVSDISAKGGPVGLYEVVLLDTPSQLPRVAGSRASGNVVAASIPAQLREEVQQQGRVQSTNVSITYLDGRPARPGFAVGAPLVFPLGVQYELYYLFPLTQEQTALALVQRVLAAAGVVLVALLAGIAWIVTRQVVTPVRMAARIAERFSAGRLEERMQVRGEDDLARLAGAFNSMATSLQRQIRQLEDLSRVQRRFVSDVSHELRTPLTTVRMAADLLYEAREELGGEAVSRSAELLQAQLDRFEALLGDLLEISRFDAGAAQLEAEPTDLRVLVRRIIEAAEPLAERQGSAVLLRVPTTPCVAEVDARRVERVLRNLVVNAIEHGEGREIVVRVACDDSAVAVGVRDHGVGLKPGESALVFNRFWRADPARARTTGGTGLGLSIALEDAHLHGGWLQAWGDPGDGSQFRLTLPRRTGGDLDASPIPLEPDDSRRRLRKLSLRPSSESAGPDGRWPPARQGSARTMAARDG